MSEQELRNYPSAWWVLWLQRGALIVVGVWSALNHAWLGVASTVVFLILHAWMIHVVRKEKVARDAWFDQIMRNL